MLARWLTGGPPAGGSRTPAGDRYSGEPHVSVSADTRQKAQLSLSPNVVVGDPDYSLTI